MTHPRLLETKNAISKSKQMYSYLSVAELQVNMSHDSTLTTRFSLRGRP